MANVRNSNTYFIDTASSGGPPATTNILDVKNIKVIGINIRATAANAVFVISDNASTQVIKWSAALAVDDTSQYDDLSDTPIIFPNGIAVTTLTNVVATLIVREMSGG